MKKTAKKGPKNRELTVRAPLHPFLPIRSKRVKERPADTDGLGAKRHSLEHIGAIATPAINEDLKLIQHVGMIRADLKQGRQRIDGVVHLPAPVVTQQHARDAQLGGARRVLGRLYALEHDRPAPLLVDPPQVVPGQGRVDLGAIDVRQQPEPAALRVRLELGRRGEGLGGLPRAVRRPLPQHHRVDRDPEAAEDARRTRAPDALHGDGAVGGDVELEMELCLGPVFACLLPVTLRDSDRDRGRGIFFFLILLLLPHLLHLVREGGGDLLHRRRGLGRDDAVHAAAREGPDDAGLAGGVSASQLAHGRHVEGERGCGAEDGGARVHGQHVVEDARAEPHGAPGRQVPAQRGPVVRRRRHVRPRLERHDGLRGRLEVVGGDDAGDVRRPRAIPLRVCCALAYRQRVERCCVDGPQTGILG